METAEQKTGYIQRAVAWSFHLKPEELLNGRRTRKFSYPRMLAMYLVRELTGKSFPWIAKHFGGVHHTSVIYACEWAIANDQYQEYIKDMLRVLKE